VVAGVIAFSNPFLFFLLFQMEMSSLLTASSNVVQVSSNHIPDDIVFSILSKLPFKSLKRFECVRKPWSLLFDNPCFMTMYHNYLLTRPCSYYDDTSLLLHLREDDDPQEIRQIYYYLYSLSGERFENRVKLDWPKALTEDVYRLQKEQCVRPIVLRRPLVPGWFVPHVHPDEEDDDDDGPFQEDDNGFEILHPLSFNGILCLKAEFYGETRVVLWNPTTNEFKLIPLPENNPSWYVSTDHYQIGYDHVKDDYKMIGYTKYSPKFNPNRVPSDQFWEIYSLHSNSWKKINVDMTPSFSIRKRVYLNGVSHWWDKTETNTYLVSFDFCKESFITTPIPSYVDDSLDFNLVQRHLMLLNGSVAFMLHYTETSTIYVSVLGELGVKESWTKHFVVGPLPCLDHLIGAGKKGNILFRKKDGELAWFDLSTGMIDEIGVTTERFYCKILFHKESLLPIGGIYTNFSSCFHPQYI
jgi:molecular chaperone HtpG